jgi:hypothetical protein
MDLKARVDKLLAAPKTILGEATWQIGARPDTREMRRVLLEDGEALGATLISQAYPKTAGHEFRHMITFLPPGATRKDARCVCRLDNSPTIDGPHINDFGGGLGYPACEVPDLHYHDWAGNRHLTRAKELPSKLLYARDIGCRINNIDDGFWWFCQQNQVDATSMELPGWPTLSQLL